MCAENIQELRDKIKTFVYFDVETTGLMKAGDQGEEPKITEFSLIAVKSDDLPGNIPSYTYIDVVIVLMYLYF